MNAMVLISRLTAIEDSPEGDPGPKRVMQMLAPRDRKAFGVRFCMGLLLFSISGLVAADNGKVIKIGEQTFSSLKAAFEAVHDNETILLGPGEYKEAGVLRNDGVTLLGSQGTVLHSETVDGKGALVINGNHTRIENIECHSITVRDKNGACVRLQGRGLTLKNVFFHDSQQGLLSGEKSGRVVIEDSRFERLGKNGLAHGVYVGGGELIIRNSHFLAAKDEGHEIKSRAAVTHIERSVIASLDGVDSRLIDVPNGGDLYLYRNVLQQGKKSTNSDVIGYGLEGYRYENNRIELVENIFLLERERGNRALHVKGDRPKLTTIRNVVVSKESPAWPGINFYFRSREEGGFPPYPQLPRVPGD